MLTCREATQLLSEKQDRILNFKEMSALQFHVLMCSSCRRFGKQMKSLSLLSKQYKKFDELGFIKLFMFMKKSKKTLLGRWKFGSYL